MQQEVQFFVARLTVAESLSRDGYVRAGWINISGTSENALTHCLLPNAEIKSFNSGSESFAALETVALAQGSSESCGHSLWSSTFQKFAAGGSEVSCSIAWLLWHMKVRSSWVPACETPASASFRLFVQDLEPGAFSSILDGWPPTISRGKSLVVT